MPAIAWPPAVAARLVFEHLEHAHVVDAGAKQRPRCRQAGDAGADDHHDIGAPPHGSRILRGERVAQRVAALASTGRPSLPS
jgi:hypothetical protein